MATHRVWANGWVICRAGKSWFFEFSFRRTRTQAIQDWRWDVTRTWRQLRRDGYRCIRALICAEVPNDAG